MRSQGVAIEDRRHADLLALSLMLFMAVNSVAIALIPVVGKGLQDSFAFSSSQIGLLSSAFMLMFAVGGIPMGMVAARLGGRTLILGVILLVVGLLVFSFSTSYAGFIVGRILQGLGASTVLPVCNPLMAQAVHSRYHARALGIFGAGHGVGVVAALLTLPSIEKAGGYRAVSLAVAGIVIVVGLLAWTPPFLNDVRGASPSVAAYLTAGAGVAQIFGNLAGAAVMARRGKPFVMLVGMAVMLVATALVPFVPGFVLIFLCVTVAGFLTMAVFPAIMGSVPDVVGHAASVGPATGFLNLTNLVGTMLVPWLFGVILDAYGTGTADPGYLLGYMFLALFPLVGTLAAMIYMWRRAPA
jgi:MFS family permease